MKTKVESVEFFVMNGLDMKGRDAEIARMKMRLLLDAAQHLRHDQFHLIKFYYTSRQVPPGHKYEGWDGRLHMMSIEISEEPINEQGGIRVRG